MLVLLLVVLDLMIMLMLLMLLLLLLLMLLLLLLLGLLDLPDPFQFPPEVKHVHEPVAGRGVGVPVTVVPLGIAGQPLLPDALKVCLDGGGHVVGRGAR